MAGPSGRQIASQSSVEEDPSSSPLKQKGWGQGGNRLSCGNWKVLHPSGPSRFLSRLPELLLGCQWVAQSRDFCWIIARRPQMDEDLYSSLTQTLVDKHQYSSDVTSVVYLFYVQQRNDKEGAVQGQNSRFDTVTGGQMIDTYHQSVSLEHHHRDVK
jgi:hypothetical protein